MIKPLSDLNGYRGDLDGFRVPGNPDPVVMHNGSWKEEGV